MTEPIPGQLDVDAVLELVVRDEQPPAPVALHGRAGRAGASWWRRSRRRWCAPADAAHLPARLPAVRALARPARRPRGPDRGELSPLSRAPGRRRASSATVKKDRAALNSVPALARRARGLPTRQVREAFAVRLPRAGRDEPRPEGAQRAQYERLIREAKARIADDPLAGRATSRSCSSSATPGCAARSSRSSTVATSCPPARARVARTATCGTARAIASAASSLSPDATRAIVRWDRERDHAFGPPPATRRCSSRSAAAAQRHLYARRRPLWTGGARRRAQTPRRRRRAAPGAAPPARAASHVRDPTAARRRRNVADVRVFLGHASVKTTSIYLASGEQRRK